MKPDLEVVQIGCAEAFKAWEHGYPFRTVRWHFHPELEIHYVVATSGRYFVGDFIGLFEPGNLVLTGPNLPHNWISETSPAQDVKLRSRVVQFTEAFMSAAMSLIPEVGIFRKTMERSRRGLLFGDRTSASIAPLLAELTAAHGVRRIELFLRCLDILARADDVRELASAGYHPDPSGFMSAKVNRALAYINDNLTQKLTEPLLASIAGLSPTTFSRDFRRHTGLALSHFVCRLRINLACQLLMSEDDMPITEICYASGFNNLSNFNRQFLRHKAMTPTRFRTLLRENFASGTRWRAHDQPARLTPANDARKEEASWISDTRPSL